MKAVALTEGGAVEVVDLPAPVPGPGDAILKMSAAGICGSDLLEWYVRRKAGTVLGHEIAGEIVELGRASKTGAARFSVGDRIVPHHHVPCFECEACRAGHFVHCAVWRSSRLDPGGMAELVRVPAANLAGDTWKIPDGVADETASWTEPLATVVKAFSRAGFQAGQSVLIVGLGSAGQLAVRLARHLDASRIAGADPVASRAAVATASGAEALIDLEQETLAEGGRRLSGGRGFDLVFVCPGKPDVIRAALECVAPGGTLLLFTMAAPGEELAISPHDLYFREVRIVPSYSCGPGETRQALDLIASRRVSVDDLVTHRFPLARASEAFARAREAEGSVKVLITG